MIKRFWSISEDTLSAVSPSKLDKKRSRVLSCIAFFLDLTMTTSVVPNGDQLGLVLLLACGFFSSFLLLLFRRKVGNGLTLFGIFAVILLGTWVRGNISGPIWMLLLAWIFFASESARYRLAILLSVIFLVSANIVLLLTRAAGLDILLPNILFLLALATAQSERFRIAYEREVADRQRRQEAEQKVEAEQFIQESRTHIARELHDIVAHSVSVMVVQARGARQVDNLPDSVEHSLKVIEDSGRESLKDLRQMIKTLRPSAEAVAADATVSPLPSFDTLDKLIEGVKKPGLEVSCTMPEHYQQVPKSMQLSLYRIVQESLTNVVRHAKASEANIEIAIHDQMLILQVVDDGRGLGESETVREGYGLRGMRERVELYGGNIVFDSPVTGGFQISVSFPLEHTL